MNTTSPALPAGRLKGLGLLADALTYPDTGETVELITARDGTKWFWLHEVAKVAELPNLKTTYRRTLEADEWRTIHISAVQDTSTNSRRGATGPNTKRVLLSLPGALKVLALARNNPKARAFDRWARHEVLAPLLTTGHVPEDGDRPVTGAGAGDDAPGYVGSLLALAFETQAGLLTVQKQQAETMAEVSRTSARLTDLLERTAGPGGRRSRVPAQRTPEAAEILERWRSRHLLGKEVWAVAAYALPIILEHGGLQASPRRIAERTGLDLATVNRALLDLVVAGLLRPVGETSRARHTVYDLGDARQ